MTVRDVSPKTVALVAVITVACLCSTGQADAGDEATTILRQAIERYNALDFQTSKAFLLSVDRSSLSAEDRRTFNSYFGWIDTAIEEQDTAHQWLTYGEWALQQGDLQEAQHAFTQAAASEFLDRGNRQLAQAKLATVRQMLEGGRNAPGPGPQAVDSRDPAAAATERASAGQAASEAFAGEIEYLAEEITVIDQAAAEEPQQADTPARPVFDEVVLAEATVGPQADQADSAGAPQWVEPLRELPTGIGGDDADARRRSDALLAAGIAAMDNGDNEQAENLFRQALMEDPRSGQAEHLLRQVQGRMAARDAGLRASDADGVSDLAQLAQADSLLEEISSELGGNDTTDTDFTSDVPGLSSDPTDDAFEDLPETHTRAMRIARIRRQQAEVEFGKAMARAQDSLDFATLEAENEGDFDLAADQVRLAQDVLETRKSLFTDEEHRTLLAQTRSKLAQIEGARRLWQQDRIEEIRRQEAEAERARLARLAEQKQERIRALTNRATTLLRENRYEQALEVLEQILELDPNSRFATDRLELLQDFVILLAERQYRRQLSTETSIAHLEVLEAMIPWHDYIRYPDNWLELSRRRLREGVQYDQSRESEPNRRVYQQLQERQTFDFVDIDLEVVIQYIRTNSGINIHVKWDALNAAGISTDTEVTVKLIDVTVEKALRVILEDVAGVNPLGFYVDEGVITISTQSDLDRNMTTRVYDIRDMILRVPEFIGPRLDLNVATQAGGQGTGISTIFEEEREDEDEMTRQEIIDSLIEKITQVVPDSSWIEGSIDEYRGQLIVKQTRENHLKILDLLNQLREARNIQIAIEARFIQVDTGFLERVGVDLDVFFNIGSTLGSPERVLSTALAPANFTTIAGEDVYTNSMTTRTDPWNGGLINRFPGDHTAQSSHWTPVGVRTGSRVGWVVDTTAPPADSIAATSVPTAMSITGSFLDDIEVDFLIEATQGSQTSRILTAPRLTLFNGQRAYITVGRQTAYIQSWRPMVAQQAAALQPIIGFIPTGSVLDVEATVSADRRYVTLTVRPQVAELLSTTTVPFSVGGGIGIGTSASITLPEVEVKDLQTTVSIPDGGTLLLGGQRFSRTTEREVGAPMLSKVPVINRFFTTRGEVHDESTLLILLKPKIIIQHEEEEDAFP